MKTVIAVVIGLGVIVLGLAGMVLLTVLTWPVLAVGLPVLVLFLLGTAGFEFRARRSAAAPDEDRQVAGR
ncbi:hypothetical protein [Pseudonocardia lacus]|uniref:hypothetical protein n=1 Tax=Pseudonocardia lacus TaxID=2835865 RepID=UPI001BDD8689|nr:hypothetical protein [Pseudonocardia lacus]